MQKMSTITWVGQNLSTDPHLPRAYEASILNPSITNYWLRHCYVAMQHFKISTSEYLKYE